MCYNMLKKIQKSFDLLDLKKDWDDENAEPIKKEVYIKALVFLLKLINNLEKDTDGLEINPCRDGSIDFSFKDDTFRLLINVKENVASWYGENANGNDKIETKNNSNEYCSSKLIEWLNEQLAHS